MYDRGSLEHELVRFWTLERSRRVAEKVGEAVHSVDNVTFLDSMNGLAMYLAALTLTCRTAGLDGERVLELFVTLVAEHLKGMQGTGRLGG